MTRGPFLLTEQLKEVDPALGNASAMPLIRSRSLRALGGVADWSQAVIGQ
jgi:hypothetical protein